MDQTPGYDLGSSLLMSNKKGNRLKDTSAMSSDPYSKVGMSLPDDSGFLRNDSYANLRSYQDRRFSLLNNDLVNETGGESSRIEQKDMKKRKIVPKNETLEKKGGICCT